MAARRPGAALDSQGPRRQAGLRLRNRRHDRHSQEPHRASTTSAPTTRCSARRCPTSTFRKGPNWLMLGPSGPRRLRLAVEHLAQYPRRHLLLRRPRSALGRQADQEGLDGAPRSLQAALHRPGDHDPRAPATTSSACSPRPSCSNRWRCGSRTMGTTHSTRPASPASSPAAPSSRRSGPASRTKSCSTAPT